MSQPATRITLAIRETGQAAQQALVYHVLVDGEVVASNRGLSPARSRAVRDLARRFGGRNISPPATWTWPAR
jgi:hypothetical protein